MIRISMELFKVTPSFKATFGLIVKNDIYNNNHTQKDVINKFSIDGNKYIQLSPYPFITFDLSDKIDKRDGMYLSNRFTVTRISLFNFINSVKKSINILENNKSDLYMYDDNDILQIDIDRANSSRVVFNTNNKNIIIQPTVVIRNTDTNEIRTLGVFLAVSKFDIFTLLSLSELKYLLYELEKVNFSELSMTAILLFNSMEENDKKEYKVFNKEPINEISETVLNESIRPKDLNPPSIPMI